MDCGCVVKRACAYEKRWNSAGRKTNADTDDAHYTLRHRHTDSIRYINSPQTCEPVTTYHTTHIETPFITSTVQCPARSLEANTRIPSSLPLPEQVRRYKPHHLSRNNECNRQGHILTSGVSDIAEQPQRQPNDQLQNGGGH